MCYLVSWFNPPKSTELSIIQTETWDAEETAKEAAAEKCLAGCTEVRVWKLIGSPSIVPTVEWS